MAEDEHKIALALPGEWAVGTAQRLTPDRVYISPRL